MKASNAMLLNDSYTYDWNFYTVATFNQYFLKCTEIDKLGHKYYSSNVYIIRI